MQADACADRHADACADIDSDALADRRTFSCTDVDVRACLHAPYHARCGLMGTHAQACTMTHTHHGTCARACTGTQSWALTRQSDGAVQMCADRAGAAPTLVHIGAGTEADLRCD